MIDDMHEAPLNIEGQAFSSQRHQFWILQISGWICYALLVFLAIVRPQIGQENFNLAGQLINLSIETLSGFILSYLQWRLIQRIVHFSLQKMLLFSFISAAILGLIYNIIKISSYKIIIFHQHWNEAWNMLEFGGWLMFSLTTMFVWTAIFFIMLYNTKLQKEHELLLLAQTSAKDSQLQMLRYQLNPHFMFNTMNAISTLIYKHENDKANEMLDKLCEFFRYSLDNKAKGKDTLKNELDLLDLYVSIEKVRFGDKLTVMMQIDNEVLNCQVPSMLLQPLVENAIKHAIEPKKETGVIIIKAKKIADRLVIQVLDNGDGLQSSVSKGFGIGMNNTKARLNAMFNSTYNINISDNEQQGTKVVISFPFEIYNE